MSQSKTVCAAVLSSWVLFCIYYYNVFGLTNGLPQPALHIDTYRLRYNITSIPKNINYYNNNNDNGNLLIDTPGCVIPDVKLKYKIPKFKKKPSCGQRAINIEKIDENHIKFLIDLDKMNIYTKGGVFTCCYQYVTRSTVSGREDTKISYSTCVPFQNGTEAILKHEVINVFCNSKSTKKKIYEDVYALVLKTRNIISRTHKHLTKWNVLVIGMDTMSRVRLISTMPRTVEYFRRHHWLDFRGYQKVGFNTFPNVMSVLTGKYMSTVYKECAKGMTYCNNELIWTRFKEAGYATAYGEDDLQLPDTFSRHHGFKILPTHHYLRPLFLTGERHQGPLLCAKKLPSAHHILNYAADFSQTYAGSNFFGFFWINSYSHNIGYYPTLIDEDIVNFFESLTLKGVMNNTIVIFTSDHGLRYGPLRISVESYYEERLPMFFMWIPHQFRDTQAEDYANAMQNQFHLTTPYDLHMTLWDVLQKGNDQLNVTAPEACPSCDSVFHAISSGRSCDDAGVSKKWCSCHTMQSVDTRQTGAKKSLDLAVDYIQNKIKTVKTKRCMKCSNLTLKKVLRIHTYTDRNKLYYVVAFTLSPGNVAFEATVEKNGNHYELQEPTETISAYNTRGDCVINPNLRSYCVCSKTKCI